MPNLAEQVVLLVVTEDEAEVTNTDESWCGMDWGCWLFCFCGLIFRDDFAGGSSAFRDGFAFAEWSTIL